MAQIVPPAITVGIPPWAIELAQHGIFKLPDVEPTSNWDVGLPPAPPLLNDASAVELLIEERKSGW